MKRVFAFLTLLCVSASLITGDKNFAYAGGLFGICTLLSKGGV